MITGRIYMKICQQTTNSIQKMTATILVFNLVGPAAVNKTISGYDYGPKFGKKEDWPAIART